MSTNKFIREPECLKITGLSRPSRWRLEEEGKFPKRYKISQNAIGWLASDIEDWIQSRLNNNQTSSQIAITKIMPFKKKVSNPNI